MGIRARAKDINPSLTEFVSNTACLPNTGFQYSTLPMPFQFSLMSPHSGSHQARALEHFY